MRKSIVTACEQQKTVRELLDGLGRDLREIEDALEHTWVFLRMGSGEPMVGDHLVSRRWGGVYTHHGIYVGDYTVIHYAGGSGSGQGSSVQEVSLEEFAAIEENGGYAVIHYDSAPFEGMDAAERARGRLGEDRYNVPWNNCEHFATWCVTGVEHSSQSRQIDVFNGDSHSVVGVVGLLKGAGGRTSFLVAGLIEAGKAIAAAHRMEAAARKEGDRRLHLAQEKWVDSENAREVLRTSFRREMLNIFRQANAVADDLVEAIKNGDGRDIEAAVNRQLEVLGSGERAMSLQEFKERFGFA